MEPSILVFTDHSNILGAAQRNAAPSVVQPKETASVSQFLFTCTLWNIHLDTAPPDDNSTKSDLALALAAKKRKMPKKIDANKVKEQAKRLRLRALLMCTYATLWGMGGHLSGEESRTACSDFIRQVGRSERIAHSALLFRRCDQQQRSPSSRFQSRITALVDSLALETSPLTLRQIYVLSFRGRRAADGLLAKTARVHVERRAHCVSLLDHTTVRKKTKGSTQT